MESLIIDLAVYGIVLPIGVGIWRYSYLEYEAKLSLFMLILVASNLFISEWWLENMERNNIPFYHVYIVLELSFISWIYYNYLKTFKFRNFIPIIAISFVTIYLITVLWNPDKLFIYSTKERAIEAGIILLFVGAYFIEIYKRQEIMYLQKTSGFWIGGGLFLYFTANLTLFTFSELVFAQESSVFQSIWAVHALLTILLYISYTIALSCKKTETTS